MQERKPRPNPPRAEVKGIILGEMVPSFSAFFSSVTYQCTYCVDSGDLSLMTWRALHKRWLQGLTTGDTRPSWFPPFFAFCEIQPWQQHPKALTCVVWNSGSSPTAQYHDYHVSIEQVPICSNCCRVYLFVFGSSLPAFASDRAPSPAPVKPQRKGGVLHEAQIEKTQRISKVQTSEQLRRN